MSAVLTASSLRQVFPRAHFSLGYGSAFFKQPAGGLPGTPDVLVFQTEPPVAWWLDFGPPVQYKLNEVIGETQAKCGLVDYDRTMRHLLDWGSFYIPGRLHKPFVVLDVIDDKRFNIFNERLHWNRVKALRLAFQLGNTSKTSLNAANRLDIRKLMEHVVGLSYLGDVRMGVAENPQKIENIVSGQIDELVAIYRPLMSNAGLIMHESTGLVEARDEQLLRETGTIERDRVRLGNLNRRESIFMAVKGLATNDLDTSAKYLARKVRKRLGF